MRAGCPLATPRPKAPAEGASERAFVLSAGGADRRPGPASLSRDRPAAQPALPRKYCGSPRPRGQGMGVTCPGPRPPAPRQGRLGRVTPEGAGAASMPLPLLLPALPWEAGPHRPVQPPGAPSTCPGRPVLSLPLRSPGVHFQLPRLSRARQGTSPSGQADKPEPPLAMASGGAKRTPFLKPRVGGNRPPRGSR